VSGARRAGDKQSGGTHRTLHPKVNEGGTEGKNKGKEMEKGKNMNVARRKKTSVDPIKRRIYNLRMPGLREQLIAYV